MIDFFFVKLLLLGNFKSEKSILGYEISLYQMCQLLVTLDWNVRPWALKIMQYRVSPILTNILEEDIFHASILSSENKISTKS